MTLRNSSTRRCDLDWFCSEGQTFPAVWSLVIELWSNSNNPKWVDDSYAHLETILTRYRCSNLTEEELIYLKKLGEFFRMSGKTW